MAMCVEVTTDVAAVCISIIRLMEACLVLCDKSHSAPPPTSSCFSFFLMLRVGWRVQGSAY